VTEHGDRGRFIDEAVHHYIQKTRPALIIQHDIANRQSRYHHRSGHYLIVRGADVPYRSLDPAAGGGLTIPSVVHVSRIRSIDTRRLVHRLGARALATRDCVDWAVLISLGLVEI
jgi:mRNA-degrading endonuclease toxin of MazEF toxin-antitoxin module